MSNGGSSGECADTWMVSGTSHAGPEALGLQPGVFGWLYRFKLTGNGGIVFHEDQ